MSRAEAFARHGITIAANRETGLIDAEATLLNVVHYLDSCPTAVHRAVAGAELLGRNWTAIYTAHPGRGR